MAMIVAFALIALLGLMALIRLAPSDPATWHVDPSDALPAEISAGLVLRQEGGAFLVVPGDAAQSQASLQRLDAIALASDRTTRLAGSVPEGRITWVTRSALWGFPDYTTAQITPQGLVLHARLRFGKSDLGVNAARLADWQQRL